MLRLFLLLSLFGVSGVLSPAFAMQGTSSLPLSGIHYLPPRQVSNIAGLDHNGQPFSFVREPHPLALVFFGYVSCTDVCPTNLLKMAQLQKQLGVDAEQVQFVFVTVDPEHETPAVMKEHLAYFQGEIVGVTGTLRELGPIYDAWGVTRTPVPLSDGAGMKFDHTAQIFLVQGHKRLRVSYPYGTAVDDMARDIHTLLHDPQSVDAPLPAVSDRLTFTIPFNSSTLQAMRNPTTPTLLRIWEKSSVVWRNADWMYHSVGDIVLAPDEQAVQYFSTPGEFYFLCTAVGGEAIRVVVKPRKVE